MKLYKILFSTTLIMGTIISISSYSWMAMWLGLEINLLSIIPIITKNNNPSSTEASMKYFIVQTIASMVVLMSATMLLMKNEFINPQVDSIQMLMMSSALLTKLGAAPFHFWFPEVMEGLSWNNCLIMLTWQKIAPFMLLMNYQNKQMLINMVMLTCLMVSSIMIINQVSLRKIMTFSSINHIAWMCAAMSCSMTTWTIYFMVYSFMNIVLIMPFNTLSMFHLSQLTLPMNQTMKLLNVANFMSLGGMPPFLGFLPKWLVIQQLNSMGMQTMATTMIIATMFTLFIYMKMSSMMIMPTEKIKTMSTKPNKSFIILTIFNSTSLILATILFNTL